MLLQETVSFMALFFRTLPALPSLGSMQWSSVFLHKHNLGLQVEQRRSLLKISHRERQAGDDEAGAWGQCT